MLVICDSAELCFGFEQALQAAKALMESGVTENSENNPDSAKE